MKIEEMNETAIRAIRDCIACHEVCLETIDYCLSRGGDYAEPAQQRLMADCAQICRLAADFMTRGSEYDRDSAAFCADVCDRCANACEVFGDAQMVECAEACREVSSACREFVETTDEPF